MPNHRLLILFAHPDDEAFPVGGTIAMHTARGVTARLVTATSGELGEIRQPGSATRETIGEVRRDELAEAIKELGIESHDVLQYRDSGMAGWDDNHHPRAFVQADEHEVVARLVFEIRRFRPQVILTFGQDGLYGHPDHIAICNHATTAFRLAADATAFPHPHGYRDTASSNRPALLQRAAARFSRPHGRNPTRRGRGFPDALPGPGQRRR